MKCSKFEEKIFLYKEISSIEQEEVDAHIKACASCRRVADQSHTLNNILGRQRADGPGIRNHAQMTRRIMEEIESAESRRARPWIGFSQIVFDSALRYGMGMLSMFLVAFFLGEYVNGEGRLAITKHYPLKHPNKIELNLTSFHAAYLAAMELKDDAPIPLSKCVSTCLRLNDMTCDACSNKFSKP